MSLPSGVMNRPPVVATHPAAVGRIVRVAGGCFVILLPLLFHVLLQVPGTARRYECVDFQRQINEARATRRKLLAERARLLAPERLRQEAERLNLISPLAGDGPWPVTIPADRLPKLVLPQIESEGDDSAAALNTANPETPVPPLPKPAFSSPAPAKPGRRTPAPRESRR